MFISLFFALVNLGLCEKMHVYVKHVLVEGHTMYAGEHPVYAFKNIPYAKPPVGALRFQLPEELNGWFSEGNLHQNTDIRCPQNAYYDEKIVPDAVIGQEDCLVLDVYVRKDHKTKNSSLPVLVYFHGGKFNSGSKEDYGPDYLLRYNDIVLVVPNYRLGILGFLSFQDAVLPGNLGLWDQNAALKWVSEEIYLFGGDPERVTIAGHEAGAASVGLHILSPPSHDYFQGAIADSGTALSPWLADTNPSPSVANRVVEALGCSATSMRGKLTCLKAAPQQDILKIQERAKKQIFVPTIDIVAENSFIPFPPKSLYQKRYQKDVNYLIGFARHEAAFEVSREFPNVLKYQHLDKMIQHFLKPHFINAPNFEMIAIAAKYHYLRRIMIPSFESLEPHIERMMTDFLYKSPLEQVIKLHMQKVNNIFVYRFKANAQDACGLENRRCFGNEFYVFNMTSRENLQHLARVNIESIIETLSKIWGNFIEHGYPDVHRRWKPYKSTDDLQHYAEISDIVQPRVNHAIDDSEFWISLVSELNAASNVTEEHSVTEPTPEYSAFRTWGVAGLAVLFGVLCVALVGVVVITKGKTLHVSIIPVSSSKETAIRN